MHSLSAWAVSALCATALNLCANTSSAGEADARFQAIYKAEWQWRDEQIPDGEDSQKPVQDHLPKVDPASQEMRMHMWQDVLQKLDAIPRAELSAAEQLNYDVYRPQIRGSDRESEVSRL